MGKRKRETADERPDLSVEIGGNAREHLRNFVARIERLDEEKQAIAADIKEVYAEAKSTGFDTKILRKLVAIRKMDPDTRREIEDLLNTYEAALDGTEE